MLRIIAVAVLCCLGGTASEAESPRSTRGPAPAALCAGREELMVHMQGAFTRLMEAHDYPGFAYAVAGTGGPIVEGGVGVANRTSRVAMGADTVFQVGSVTKMFTGALLAQLAADDTIELGDRLSAHWFAEDRLAIDSEERPVTLQAIATHTAGLPRYPDNLNRQDGDPILGYPLERMREALRALPAGAESPPGWAYSNFGYGVLAQAVSRAQNAPFELLLEREVIEPAGLRDTGFSLNRGQAARLATPYRDDDITRETQPWQMGAMSAAGGLYSTVRDLARFGAWLQSAEAGSAEAHMLQRAPLVRQSPRQAYGLGMFVVDNYVDDVDVLWHGGDVDGYAGSLVILPDHGIAIAYMTNIGFANGFAELQNSLISRAAELCGDLGGHF